jgi:sugar O-acyltransferase (sialic acid O-acetyltransferase NeuD family)
VGLLAPKLYVFGCGGHSKVVTQVAAGQGLKVDGYIVSNADHKEFLGRPVIGEDELDCEAHAGSALIAVGDNRGRKTVVERLRRTAAFREYPSLVDVSAHIAPTAELGEGTLVLPGAVINASARIGAFSIVNSGAIVEHDCVLGDFTMIAPGAVLCGSCSIGEGAWIGAGATIIQKRQVGAWSMIGAGAVVVADIKPGVVAFGNPASVQRNISTGKTSV